MPPQYKVMLFRIGAIEQKESPAGQGRTWVFNLVITSYISDHDRLTLYASQKQLVLSGSNKHYVDKLIE